DKSMFAIKFFLDNIGLSNQSGKRQALDMVVYLLAFFVMGAIPGLMMMRNEPGFYGAIYLPSFIYPAKEGLQLIRVGTWNDVFQGGVAFASIPIVLAIGMFVVNVVIKVSTYIARYLWHLVPIKPRGSIE